MRHFAGWDKTKLASLNNGAWRDHFWPLAQRTIFTILIYSFCGFTVLLKDAI